MGRKKVEEHTQKFTVKREGCHFRLVTLREFWCHDKYIKKIDAMLDEKNKEIMTV